MYLPQFIAAALLARQSVVVLPSSYCSPDCPTCRVEALAFHNTTSCVENSTFINSCGNCQTCVLTYSIENLDANTDQQDITPLISSQLNKCLNTPGERRVQQYALQVSNLTALFLRLIGTGSLTTSVIMETRTSSLTMVGSISSVTSGSSWSGDLKSDSGDWTIFSTATWASVYFSVLSEASKSAMIASSPMQTFTIPKSSTSNPVSNPTSISTPTKSMTSEATNSPNSNSTISLTSSTSTLPLNKTWIIGPIIGSLLGMSTVLIVIFFTRRKQQREFLLHQHLLHHRHIPIDTEPYMKFGGLNSPASTSSHNSYDDGYLGTGEKAQLHGDSMEMGELQGRELMAPVELPAREPVGSELLTSIGKSFRRKRKGEGSPISPSTPGGERLRDSKRDEEEETDIGMMDIPWIALQEENSNGRMEEIEDELEEVVEEVEWPLPMSPLQELFKKTEMRDGKADVDEVRHETYYHP